MHERDRDHAPPRDLTSVVASPVQPPRLLDQLRAALRLRHASPRTETAYVYWARRYILFHDKRHPAELGPDAITAFLNFLAVEKHVAASTQNQALNAIVFLYRHVLDRDVPQLGELVRARKPHGCRWC